MSGNFGGNANPTVALSHEDLIALWGQVAAEAAAIGRALSQECDKPKKDQILDYTEMWKFIAAEAAAVAKARSFA